MEELMQLRIVMDAGDGMGWDEAMKMREDW